MKKDFCEYCNSPLPEHEKPTTVYRHKGERHFLFQNVPTKVCTPCGERYFQARAVRQMEPDDASADEILKTLFPFP